MAKEYILNTASDIHTFKETREAYKKQFWLKAKSMDPLHRKQVKKLFAKIDRLRNHLKLWLKQLISKKPANRDSYIFLMERGKKEIRNSFKQLDQVLHQPS